MYVVYQQVKHLRVVLKTEDRIAAAFFYVEQLTILNIQVPTEVDYVPAWHKGRQQVRGAKLNVVV